MSVILAARVDMVVALGPHRHDDADTAPILAFRVAFKIVGISAGLGLVAIPGKGARNPAVGGGVIEIIESIEIVSRLRCHHYRSRAESGRGTLFMRQRIACQYALTHLFAPAIRQCMNQPASLADRRKALELSQEQLALLLGVNQATVSRNENAEQPDRRYALSIEALAMRKERGEDLAATAQQATAA